VVEECEEVRAGIHGMNDDVSIVITDDDDKFDHGGCTVRTDERIARRVFVGIEVELTRALSKAWRMASSEIPCLRAER
jgi:hypothetical protein